MNPARSLAAILAAAVVSAAAGAADSGYPAKPVRLIIGSPAGGSTDILARLMGQRLNDAFGQPVIVDPRPGASGLIAGEIAARANPDGYTLLFPSLQHVINGASIRACVDDASNIEQMAEMARKENVTLGVLVEVDVGMNRCGVEPGEPALKLARAIAAQPGLRFVGLQGYDGHLQLVSDREEKEARCREGLDRLLSTRKLIEQAGIAVEVVTGAGTGTWEFAAAHPGLTELQPGSFLLMDAAYQVVRPEFACSLTILTTVISRRPGWYVLDAGSKAISQDFGKAMIKGHPEERVLRLAEEHAKVEDDGKGPAVGQRREVIPAHCCATMNLHRTVLAVRKGKVEAVWPVEASGRYD